MSRHVNLGCGFSPTPSRRPLTSDHDQAVAWFRAFLHAAGSGDDALRRLAQRELRALGIAVAPIPLPLRERSVAQEEQISATSPPQIRPPNVLEVSAETSPHASAGRGMAPGRDGEPR